MIEIIEKKSKFVGYLFKIGTIDDAKKHIQDLKMQHKKATHVCYAYTVFCGQIYSKCDDDGEPSGTAGKPILNVIEKKKASNVLVCVVRYFGGVKLGAGGLVRAYTKCASEVFKEQNDINKS